MLMQSRARVIAGAGLAAGFLSFCGAPRAPVFTPGLEKTREYYQAGEFEKALEACHSLYLQYPEAGPVREEYVRTLEGIKSRADAALAARDYTPAEEGYTALLDRFEGYKSLRKSLTFTASDLGRLIRECRSGARETRVDRYLQAGEYEQALGTQRSLSPTELRDPGLAAGIARTMEEIKRRGDAAQARGDYAATGNAYAALAGRYSDVSRLGLRLSFGREELAEGLRRCRLELTRQGLEQYRRGNLSEAISIWRSLLRFDPENPEIEKAVETAGKQLKELQKKQP
jgi:tetratricopeptide (TPR) repeat protein